MPREDYVVLKPIGRGNFGAVSLCEQRATHKEFIIKEVSLVGLDSAQRKATIEEVRLLRQIDCAFIVRYADSWLNYSDDSTNSSKVQSLAIVMSYCHGGDLHSQINQQQSLAQYFSEDTIIDWFISLCLALKYCHDRKILHRDIKAQNIFLTRGGDVRLGDFGIARQLNNSAELAMTVIGTPYCMSPEVCQSQPYHYAADIWSLGCVLYQLTALRLPFTGENLLGLVYKICHSDYEPIPAHYSEELKELIARMLAKNPSERPTIKTILQLPMIMNRVPIIAQRLRERNKGKHRTLPSVSTVFNFSQEEATHTGNHSRPSSAQPSPSSRLSSQASPS